ncbi:MAG: methyltransferase domain-containing protein [Verrucomicrobiota bacterium]
MMSIYGWVQKPFRERRLKLYQEVIHPTPQTTILDVGGSPWFWTGLQISGKITVLNPDEFSDQVKADYPTFQCVGGDGCNLSYPPASFDVGFSNSAIEHVGTFERQKLFAAEIRRVGKTIWVQTPAREFPIEPHFMAPFIHYFPRWLQRKTVRYFTLLGLLNKPSPAQIEDLLNEIRLLSFREMQELFPDCEIYREKILGITKSYVAIRRNRH